MRVIVTAGPTREPLDPVRFISNYSTGFLGYEIAQEAKRRGHQVILISGPSMLAKPQGVRSINVETARQMQKELQAELSWCDCLIMTAAVCDFRPKTVLKKKIRRGRKKELRFTLKQNPDILASIGSRKGKMVRQRRKILVGFALETENLRKNAQDKLKRKNLDLILATQMKANSFPFGRSRLDALIIDKKGQLQQIRQATKRRLAGMLLERIEKIASD